MKCQIFTGTWKEARDDFNKWAKHTFWKDDLIIHEQIYRNRDSLVECGLMIIVYYEPLKGKDQS
jgi:hypothetical protein